jgi:tetratricopeptide (TPR) repeat protein
MDANDRTHRLDTANRLVEHAASLSQQRDLTDARQRLDEATMVLQPLGDDDDPNRVHISANVAEGKGQIALNTGRTDEAYFQFSQAIELRAKLMRLGHPNAAVPLAIDHLNLSAVCREMKRPADALAETERAVDVLGAEAVAGDPTARMLRVASLQSLGAIHSAMDAKAEALAAFETATEEGLVLESEGVEMSPAMLTQIYIQRSVEHFQLDQPEEARTLGQEASDRAWQQLEADGGNEILTQYVTTLMNHVTFSEALGEFAAGEDALFKALKLVGPQAEILTRGRQYYTDLLDLDDAALDAGNLPRDEVLDSLAEIEGLIAQTAQA